MKMIRVNRKNPCPVCKKPDWCSVSANGEVAICMRVQSDRPTKNSGFLHILKERPVDYRYIPRPVIKEEPKVNIDVNGMIAEWRGKTTQKQIEALAEELNVSPLAIRRLDAVWAKKYQAWAFPMRNENSKIIGIRLRNSEGFKWTVTGTHAGLFIPAGLSGKRIIIAEGNTDTLAGLSLGFDIIGRPSCRGQEEMIVKWLKLKRYDEFVLLIDNDQMDRFGKYVGLEGALNLARVLEKPVKLIRTPCKDLRAWVAKGLTYSRLDSLIKDTKAKIIKPE